MWALDLSGGNERVVIPHNALFNFTNLSAYSFGAWVKTSATAFMVIMGKTQGISAGANVRGWDLYLTSSGRIGFNRNNNFELGIGNYSEIQYVASPVNDGRLHHIVATCAGGNAASTMKLYLDGANVPVQVNKDTLTGTIANTSSLVIGDQSTLLTGPYTGIIASPFVFNRELSALEVAGIYADHSYALSFDGGEYVTMGDAVPLRFERTNTLSLHCRARWTGASVQILMGKMGNLTQNRGYDLHTGIEGGINFNLNSDNAAGNKLGVRTSIPFNDGKWHDIWVTYDGSSSASGVHIWVDGVDRPLVTYANNLSATIATSAAFILGGRLEPGFVFGLTGQLDDPAVFNRVINSGEIVSAHQSGIAKMSGLVGYWPVIGSIHPTLTDASSNSNNGTMTNMESDDITLLGGNAPVISNVIPASGGKISRGQAFQFDVTDDERISHLGISVRFAGRPTEKVYGAFGFEYGYENSSVVPIAGGYHFTISRNGGWPGNPTWYAEALDFRGLINA